MSEYVEKLKEDLSRKLDELCLIQDQPDWHVSEYFARIRREVDLDAELVLEWLKSAESVEDKDQRVVKLNETRVGFVRVLDELEARTLNKMPKIQENGSSDEAYKSLREIVELFSLWTDIDEADEAYVTLAVEIIEATNRLEKRILGEQATLFVSSKNATLQGSLFHFGEDYLSRQELELFTHKSVRSYSAAESEQTFVKALNLSLLVPLSRPFVLAKAHLIVREPSKHVYDDPNVEPMFYTVASSSRTYSGYTSEDSSLIKSFLSYQHKLYQHQLPEPEHYAIDGISASAGLFNVFSDDHLSVVLEEHMRPVRLDAQLLPANLKRLTLENVQIDAFDPDSLAKCGIFECLTLHATFSADLRPDFEFLRAMKSLVEVHLTLPDWPVDLGVFENVETLDLAGPTKLDANKPLRKLNGDDMTQLASMSLKQLALSYFEIESVGQDGPRRLEQLTLRSNRIGSISERAFVNLGSLDMDSNEIANGDLRRLSWTGCLVRTLSLLKSGIGAIECFCSLENVQQLNLSGNSIEELPRGVFERAIHLSSCDLSRNRIRAIRRGVLPRFQGREAELILDENPIETIQAGAFINSEGLERLSMTGCRLKSITHDMFKGLRGLTELNLAGNNIESLDASDDGLFEDMIQLKTLDLSRNKLEKIDLNCFWHLHQLKKLNLESCTIRELNSKARPGLLRNLDELILRDNQLTSLDKRAFAQSLKLGALDMSGNKLRTLEDGFFAPFCKLVQVNLGRNELTMTIDRSTFASSCHALCMLVLSNNRAIRIFDGFFGQMSEMLTLECELSALSSALSAITGVECPREPYQTAMCLEVFNHHNIYKVLLKNSNIRTLRRNQGKEASEPDALDLSWLSRNRHRGNLHTIDFSGNLIESLDDPDLFASFPNLTDINLSGNRLRHIERGVFYGIELKKLDLSNNCLFRVDLGVFRGLLHLTSLDLSGNGIGRLDLARLLRACPTLERLRVADNELDEGSVGGAWHLGVTKRLHELDLANNRLESVHFASELTGLRRLDLSNNRIGSIEQDGVNLLGRLVKLTHLDLSRNRIGRFEEGVFARMRAHLEHLDISNNPLEHDSILAELI